MLLGPLALYLLPREKKLNIGMGGGGREEVRHIIFY
jgi:hypothetical protein